MTGVFKRTASLATVAILCTLTAGGCSDARKSPVSPMDGPALFGKTTSVSVSATNPPFGDQGQVNELVTITGTGFKTGATPAWLRNGIVDGTIHVSSSNVVSSTTMTAVISIDSNSPLDFRDVQVTNFDRTQGIGDAVFEVTQAQVIPGTLAARDANDDGEITGSLTNGGTFYYNTSSGVLDTVSSATGSTGYDINALGNAIAGGAVGGGGSLPYLYTRSGPIGTPWTATALPVGPNAVAGMADAMVADPVTGQVTMLGGEEDLAQVHGAACSLGSNAIVWSWQASTGTWLRIPLPTNGACKSSIRPHGMNANGIAVGYVQAAGGSTVAAVWTPTGTGGYTLTQLNGSFASGIDANSSMIVGDVDGHTQAALYWLASGGGWSQAFTFPGGCASSRDIDNTSGRVVLENCPFGSNTITYAAFIDPPYTTPMKLGGIGGHSYNFVASISPSGAFMTGYGSLAGGTQLGVYWKP